MSRHSMPVTRRTFLQTTAAGAATLAFAGPRLAFAGQADKLNIAAIGVQNRAWANISGVRHENIVALCDVDRDYLNRAHAEFPQAQRFTDFRELLSSNLPIDAVVVSTPDHTHGPAAAMALRKGKHVYCEKPLTHSVYETRVLTDLAREQGVATQMGTQIHAGENYRQVVELIQSGAIGKVREVHVWCGKSWSNGRFQEEQPAPENLDWDLWLGPAAKRPFSPGLHPGNWRRFWPYGTGTLGDMACHYVDLVFWALELTYPTRVVAEGPEVHPVGTPQWLVVHYDFPARGEQPPVKLHWYDGGKRPDIVDKLKLADGSPVQWGDGHLFIGEKGMLISDYGRHLLLPEERFAEFKRPEPFLPRSIGHHREWLQACRGGEQATCDFSYAGPLTEAVLLGTIAYRLGKPLEWDAKKLIATNAADEAAQLIRPPMREGFEV